MQALPANRRFIEAFDLRPIVMMRSIPDMLASYWDMLENDETALRDGLNCLFPANFPSLTRERKADFLVDILAPWYASYCATWLDYAEQSPERICVLRYEEFLPEPGLALGKALSHAGVPRAHDICNAAIEGTWEERRGLRFNRGEQGRGRISRGAISPASRKFCLTIPYSTE